MSDLPEFERYHHRFAVTEEVLHEQDFGREPGFVALVDGAPEPVGCCAGCLCRASSRSR